MGTISLIIKKDKINKQGLCGLYLRYSHGEYTSAYISLGTNFKISPKDFDTARGQVRKTVHEAIRSKIDIQFNDTRMVIDNIIKGLEIQRRIPEPALVKQIYLGQETVLKHKTTFWEAFEVFLSQGTGDRGENTLKKYIGLKNKLKAFENAELLVKADKKVKFGIITWDRLDFQFYQLYNEFLIGNGLTANTVGRNVKYVKTFLSWARKMKYHSSFEYLDWKATSAEPSTFALEDRELQTLIDFEPKNPRLERIKHLFLLQIALGGLRYSDTISLKRSYFRGNGEYIELTSQKVKRSHIIKVTPEAQEYLALLDTGEEEMIKRISLDKYNQYIKELFKEAGLDRPITKVHYIGREKREKTMPLYEAAGSHLARRTTITMLSQDNADYKLIARIAGQADIKTTMGYSRRPTKDVSDTLTNFTSKLKKTVQQNPA